MDFMVFMWLQISAINCLWDENKRKGGEGKGRKEKWKKVTLIRLGVKRKERKEGKSFHSNLSNFERLDTLTKNHSPAGNQSVTDRKEKRNRRVTEIRTEEFRGERNLRVYSFQCLTNYYKCIFIS